ncbi:alpha/beta hydrolase [Brucella lupini]|jgi:acetyl esterase/lipase|nr:alpha/beta hydrolase [Brucella lupini]
MKAATPESELKQTRREWTQTSSILAAMRQTCLVASVFLGASSVNADENGTAPSGVLAERTVAAVEEDGPRDRMTPESTLANLLNHPAFAGHARLLLPWDDRAYDETMPISEIGSLLPYHSNVDPDVVVSALNRMINDADDGNTIFYDIYTPEEKRAEPGRANTGLFFFRGRPGAPFAIVAPGGGFAYVGSVHEGFPYAAEISKAGYNAFVLKYRVGSGGGVATEDLAAALAYVFRNADALDVSTADYSLWGSSAGARMAAAIGSHGAAAFGGGDLPKPSAVVMAYTGHSDMSANEPPTFVVVGERDGIAPPSAMERRVAALRKTGTEVAYRKYQNLGHGFGPGTGTSAEGWIADAVRFWEKFIKPGSVQ